MTNTDKIKSIIKGMTFDDDQKREGCEYRGTEKYCKATTNKTCKHCDFFTPTWPYAIQTVVNEYKNLESEIDAKNDEIRGLKKALDAVEKSKEYYKRIATEYKDTACPDRMRCNPYFSSDVTCEAFKPLEKISRKGRVIFR